MKNLLIGSRALNHWDKSLGIKEETDWDIISDFMIEGAEMHDPYHLNNYALERYASTEKVEFNGKVLSVVNPMGLALIKRSHLHRDLSFGKHITHYHKHLAQYAKWFSESDEVILGNRIRATQKAYPKQHPRLNVTVEEFFDDAVPKVYDHDYLHSLLAYEDKPMYSRLQRDDTKAWCEKDLWNELTHTQKIQCVAEETQVIAVERFMVPNNWNYIPKKAYMASLQKVCTTLTSGWFRDFAIDNYPELVLQFDAQRILGIQKLLKE